MGTDPSTDPTTDPTEPPAVTDPPEPTFTPPTEKEWRAVQAALKKANDDQRAQRQAALDKARTEGEQKAAKEAAEAAEQVWRPRLVKKEAKLALKEAGCEKPDRLLSLIETDKCTVNDDGDVIGLEAQVATLKKDWPELFKGKPKPAGKDVDASDRGGNDGGGKAKSTAELLAARAMGAGS